MQSRTELKKLNLTAQKKLFLMEFQNLEKKGFFKKDVIYARELNEAFSPEIVHPEILNGLMETLAKKGISVHLKEKEGQDGKRSGSFSIRRGGCRGKNSFEPCS